MEFFRDSRPLLFSCCQWCAGREGGGARVPLIKFQFWEFDREHTH
jgi:hypothetical protein